jgi:DNA-binding beta-propeller fold protein YncE
MRRAASAVTLFAAAFGLAACVGKTNPATDITSKTARLHAQGYTDDGPATWWWEYDTVKSELGTATDTEICGNPPEADKRCGPAEGGSEANPVHLGQPVSGLTPDTTYYFRACGQDEGEGPTCGNVLSFKTLTEYFVFDRKWGSEGSGNGQFQNPRGIATWRTMVGDFPVTYVYVADTGNNRVQRFGSTGNFINTWGGPGSGNSQFSSPVDVETDASGNVYVVDQHNDRIQKFTSTGSYTLKWGSEGTGNSQFNSPAGVAISGSSVYVTDAENHRVQKFSHTGIFALKWGSEGSGNGQFKFPAGVATDAAGNVYVVDNANHRVQKFTSSGAFVTKWGSQGSGDGQFFAPIGIATDAAGYVYVADYGNHRIQKFTSSGAFVTKWGSQGSGDGRFFQPGGVATSVAGPVYVSDTLNDRIQRFLKE